MEVRSAVWKYGVQSNAFFVIQKKSLFTPKAQEGFLLNYKKLIRQFVKNNLPEETS